MVKNLNKSYSIQLYGFKITLMKISINTDLIIRGESLHVQTEDWGSDHQKIVCRVFKSGRVIRTRELTYEKIQKTNQPMNLKKESEKLHQDMIDLVHEGKV